MLLDAFRLSHKHTQALVQCILQLKDDKKLISIQFYSFAGWVSRESVMAFKSRPVSSRLVNFYFYFFDISIYARQLAVEEKSYHSCRPNRNRKFISEKKSRVMREPKTTKTQQLDEESEKINFRHPRTKNRPDESAEHCDIEKRKTISLCFDDDGGWRKISIKI